MAGKGRRENRARTIDRREWGSLEWEIVHIISLSSVILRFKKNEFLGVFCTHLDFLRFGRVMRRERLGSKGSKGESSELSEGVGKSGMGNYLSTDLP